MLTKSAAACIVSGVLVSVILPEGALAASRGTVVVASSAPTSLTPGAAHLPSRPVRQSPAPLKNTVPDSHEAVLPPQGLSLGKKRKGTAKRLGIFTVRAYTHYTHPPNKTASGTAPRAGRTVAVDPRVIPLGSRIYVEGIGELVAEDTGTNIKGRSLDLFLPSIRDCRQFGRRQHDVYLIVD
ncbi:MAG: 3D domain-containing protein [Candidatus Binatia bacterium]|nr:3D domain-containing protein [Candidatus Binatia bacterium]